MKKLKIFFYILIAIPGWLISLFVSVFIFPFRFSSKKRKHLRALARKIADESKKMPYAYWKDVEFPCAYEIFEPDKRIQIELNLLENTSSYLLIDVSADGGSWPQYSVGYTFIVEKKEQA